MKTYSPEKQNSTQILKNIEKNFYDCEKLVEQRMAIANESYFLLEDELKNINTKIDRLEVEQDASKINEFSFQNYALLKQIDEYVEFSNYLGLKKKSKNKKAKKTLKNVDMRLIQEIKGGKKKKNQNKIGKRGKISKVLKDPPTCPKLNENNLMDITYQEIDRKAGDNEQTYCFCNYISYGNMVKCDNPKCPIEWFHFHCVGLRNLPKGKWFCSSKCQNEYEKSK